MKSIHLYASTVSYVIFVSIRGRMLPLECVGALNGSLRSPWQQEGGGGAL